MRERVAGDCARQWVTGKTTETIGTRGYAEEGEREEWETGGDGE